MNKNNKIDFVITWVDGSDLKWQKEKEKYEEKKDLSTNGNNRYRDMECLKYWFRAVEKYAPWVNKIYFVTWGHYPEWLNIKNKKLVIVNHKDFIPKEYLPTFSSNVIEINLHRIKGLNEKFVNFNDDVFINDYVSEKDFFENNLPKEYAILNPIIPNSKFMHIVLNDMILINKNFDLRKVIKNNRKKFINMKYGKENLRTIFLKKWKNACGFKESHITHSFLKSTFFEVWEKEYDTLNNTSKHKFRRNEDVNEWLMEYWQFMKGEFYPNKISFGKRFDLKNDNKDIINAIKNNKYKIICINDSDIDCNFEKAKKEIITVFEEKLKDKSSFEI